VSLGVTLRDALGNTYARPCMAVLTSTLLAATISVVEPAVDAGGLTATVACDDSAALVVVVAADGRIRVLPSGVTTVMLRIEGYFNNTALGSGAQGVWFANGLRAPILYPMVLIATHIPQVVFAPLTQTATHMATPVRTVKEARPSGAVFAARTISRRCVTMVW